MNCSMPASRASSTPYWITGLSTTGSISFGTALVAGRNRVPMPATGKTALRIRGVDMDGRKQVSYEHYTAIKAGLLSRNGFGGGMKIFLTGVAGFIGASVAHALLEKGHAVSGVDSLNAYYDPALKRARLARLRGHDRFCFTQADIADDEALGRVTRAESFEVIVHLAAQAGVRHALDDPFAYTQSNLVGHHNILELGRHMKGLKHLIYASSSSVYGNDTSPPFSEGARADRPVSYYGATKRAGELMSHSYAELFGLNVTGLRFFTVYGPWGRPDMAYWLFTDAILKEKPLKLFGGGLLRRDFTWIDDIVTTVLRMTETPFAHAES